MSVKKDQLPPNLNTLSRVPIRRLSFVMKYIAEGNLWDEFEAYLEDRGYLELMISSEPIAAIQELIKEKVATGSEVHKRGQRFMASIHCGQGHPTLPPVSPTGGGDAGAPDGGTGN